MTRPTTSLAALLLDSDAEEAFFSFADLILASRIGDRASTKSVTWDCEDLVFLDFDDVRIALQYANKLEGLPCRISLAIGVRPGATSQVTVDCNRLARLLVQRMSSSLTVKLVLWQETPAPPTAEVMDEFQDELTAIHDYLDCYVDNLDEEEISPMPRSGSARAARACEKEPTADSQSSIFDIDTDKMQRWSDFKAEQEKNRLSSPMHASIYVAACTLMFLVPAIGTALFSYAAIRDGLDSSALIS